jgi:hypothetical protein
MKVSYFLIPNYEELITSQFMTRASLNSFSSLGFFISQLTNISFQMVIIKICLVQAWFLVGFVLLKLVFSVYRCVNDCLSFVPICCLSVDLRLLIIPLVSSDFSYCKYPTDE